MDVLMPEVMFDDQQYVLKRLGKTPPWKNSLMTTCKPGGTS